MWSSFTNRWKRDVDLHKAITSTLVITTALLLLAKGIGLGKEMMIAMKFGTGLVADIYALAFMFALWPGGIWMAVVSSVLIPLTFKGATDVDSARFRDEMLGLSLVVGATVGTAVYFALAYGVHGRELEQSAAARALLHKTALGFGLIAGVGLINAVLMSQLLAGRNRFASLMDGVPSLTVLVFLASSSSGGPWPLVIGTVFGFCAQTALMVAMQPSDLRSTRPRFSQKATQWRTFWRGAGLLIVSQAMLSATGVIDQIAATGLGASANATLGYANRIVLLVMSLISLTVTRAILPVLSQASNDRPRAWRLATTWAMGLFAIALVAATSVAVAAPFAVRLLFERGSFTATDTLAVSEAIRFGMFQIPFFCGGMVVVQYVAATQRYQLFLWGNAVNLLVKLGANALLIPTLGVPGAMLATAIMYAVSTTFLWITVRPGRGSSVRTTGTN